MAPPMWGPQMMLIFYQPWRHCNLIGKSSKTQQSLKDPLICGMSGVLDSHLKCYAPSQENVVHNELCRRQQRSISLNKQKSDPLLMAFSLFLSFLSIVSQSSDFKLHHSRMQLLIRNSSAAAQCSWPVLNNIWRVYCKQSFCPGAECSFAFSITL